MSKIILLIITLCLHSFLIFSQEVKSLVTDRPDQTESSVTVPLNSLQIESGFLYEYDKYLGIERETTTYNTTLLRYGLLDNLELRAGMDYNKYSQSHAEAITGFGTLNLGAKIFITDEQGWKPEMALLTNFVIPGTGKDQFSPQNLGGSIILTASHVLGQVVSIGYNLGSEWDGDKASATGIYSFVVGFSVTDRLGAFIESYGLLPENAKPDHRADGGLTYLITDNFQLDASTGIGLMEYSPDYFLSFGFTLRLPR